MTERSRFESPCPQDQAKILLLVLELELVTHMCQRPFRVSNPFPPQGDYL